MAEPTTTLRLRVSPGASRTEFVGRHGSAWKMRVSSVPERGRVNHAVVRLLASRLDVPRTSLTMVSGHTGRDKLVELGGLDAAQAERRLEKP